MKKTSIILVIGALIASIAVAGPAKKKVLVTKTTTDKATKNAADVVGEKICNEVFESKKVESFCASTLESLMRQQSSLAMLGGGQQACTGGDCNELYAKRVSAEYLITSAVKQLGKKEYLVSVQLIRFADAKTLERFEKKVDKIEKTYDAAAEGASKVLAKL